MSRYELLPDEAESASGRYEFLDSSGFAIDTSRPKLQNDDGSFSTEETITVGIDDRHYNIPTIWYGRRLEPAEATAQALDAMDKGMEFPSFATLQEATTAARQRSADIGQVRGSSQSASRYEFVDEPASPSLADRVRGQFGGLQSSLDSIGGEPSSGPRRRLGPAKDEQPSWLSQQGRMLNVNLGRLGELPKGGPPQRKRQIAPAWSEVLSQLPGQIGRDYEQAARGVAQSELDTMAAFGGVDALAGGPPPYEIIQANRAAAERGTVENLGRLSALEREQQAAQLPDQTLGQRAVTGAARSVAVGAPALAAGIATRNPALPIAIMAGQTGASKYGERRAKGDEPAKAAGIGAIHGTIEGVTELVPAKYLFRAGTPAFNRLVQVIAAEVPGENAAMIGQSVTDALADAPREVTAGDFVAAVQESLRGIPETTAATVLASGVQSGAVSAADRLSQSIGAKLVQRAQVRAAERVAGAPAGRFEFLQDAGAAVVEPRPPFTSASRPPAIAGAARGQSQPQPTVEGYTVTEAPLDEATKQTFARPGPDLPAEENLFSTVGGGRPSREWLEATGRTGKGYARQPFFRGSRGPLTPEKFTREALAQATGHPTAGLGVFFSNRREDAQQFGEHVEQVYLDLRNPKTVKAEELPAFESADEAFAWRESIRAQGHDGLIIDASHLDGPVWPVAFNPEQVVREHAGRYEFIDDQGEVERSGGVQRSAGSMYVPMCQALPTVPQQNTVTIAPGTTHARTVAIPKEPVRREHIVKELQRLFPVHVYQGAPWNMGRKTLGFFRPKTGEVRIRAKNDLEVTAHEFFHWLDRAFPTIRKLYHEAQFRQELKGVSYDESLIFEGFAEFGRLFLTQADMAARRTPTFYKAFIAEAQKAGILGKLLAVQGRMHQWYHQGSEARARSKIGSKPAPFRQWLHELFDRAPDRAIQQSLDFLQSVKVIERTIAGTITDAVVSPYKNMRLVAGARGVTRAVLNHGTIRWDVNGDIEFSGPGLKQVFEPVADIIDDVMAYFAGRRAQELASQGREHLFTKDEIKALVSIGHTHAKQAEIRKAFIEFQKFNDRALDFYQQSGIISGEHRRMMQAMNQAYVPFHRIMDSVEKGQRTPGQDSFKRLKGGTENVRDIFENIVGGVQALTTAALRNRAKLQLYSLLESSRAGARFAVRVPTEERATKVSADWIIRQIHEWIPDKQLAAQLEAMIRAHPEFADMVLYWSAGHAPDAPDLDVVLSNGKPLYFQVGDPLLMETLGQFNRVQPAALALRILGGFSNTLRRGITLLPDFQIPNLLRDSFNAFALSKGKQIPVVDSIRGMVQRLRNDKDYFEFLANGGGFSSQVHGETGGLRTKLERYYAGKKINYKTVLDTPQKVLDAWDELASAFEYGTRLAEFKKMRKRGASKREAAFQGRNISTDFAMRGASDFLRILTVSVPFLNARMQGLYMLQRHVMEKDGRIAFNREQATSFALRAVAGIMAPTIALWWLFHDDERVKALPQWVRLSHWTIPSGDGVFLIPKPFEIGALFATVPEQILELIEKRDGPAFADAMAFVFVNAFGFNPTPQAVKPMVDIARNKSWTGAPIVPESLKDVAPPEQFNPWTSDMARVLAQSMPESAPDVLRSPVKLDYLVRGYLGTFGQYSLTATDALFEPAIESGAQPTGSFGDEFVIRRFVRRAPYRGTAAEDEFYKVLEETREAVATFRKIQSDQRYKAAERFLDDPAKQVLIALSGSNITGRRTAPGRKGAEQIAKKAAELSALMRQVRLNPDLSADEKRAQLDALQYEKNLLFDAAASVFSRKNVADLAERAR